MEMVLNGGRCLDCGPTCPRWEHCGGIGEHLGPDTGSLETYKTFEEVLESVDKQFEYWTDQMCSSLCIIDNAHRALKPLPYVSAIYEDCMESGKDLTEGGAKYNGIGPQASGMATCADSLATIKQLVFDEKKCTGAELLQAVKDNWVGHEKLYALVNSSKVHHYGNDDDYADELFEYMFQCYCRHITGRVNPRGGYFSPGVYSVNANVAMGLNTNASVDGRKAGEAISENMGPVHTDCCSHDICGPTALTNSLTKVDHSLASNGTLMNMRFPQDELPELREEINLLHFLDEYLSKGAMHVQFNIMSVETMKAAQKKPEDYKDMLVRVAGYSAYFVELGKPLQKDLIGRTELHFLEKYIRFGRCVESTSAGRKGYMKERDMDKKRLLYIVLGPVLFAICTFAFKGALTLAGAEAVGVLLWMIFWWVTRPVNITVTAFVPIMANALFNIIPMENVISRYFSDSIILILGSCFSLTIPWKSTGLDRRIALRVLSIVGPSIKSQIIVWLIASMVFSTVLPNIAVVALFCPIAVAMLHAAGYDDISKSKPAIPILLCIGWGAELGGVGSPLWWERKMNVAAISFLQDLTGKEFMYIDWVLRILPFFIISTVVMLAVMLFMYRKEEPINGTKRIF